MQGKYARLNRYFWQQVCESKAWPYGCKGDNSCKASMQGLIAIFGSTYTKAKHGLMAFRLSLQQDRLQLFVSFFMALQQSMASWRSSKAWLHGLARLQLFGSLMALQQSMASWRLSKAWCNSMVRSHTAHQRMTA